MAGFVVACQILACLGYGMVVLRLVGVAGTLTRAEHFTWSFALGFGVLGWLVFFVGVAGLAAPLPLGVVVAVGAAAMFAFRGAPRKAAEGNASAWAAADRVLVALLAVILAFSLAQGLSPPTDGDSLAYHFALPKQFLGDGRVTFVPRAMDGAIPLLPHMTYMTALGLGGERAMTLWSMASGWMAAALLFTLARRFLDRRWALAVAVAFLGTPAVVYGAGSGQVEVRNALFAMMAAFAVATALGTGLLRHAVLAGLAAGFFMAGKYLGLQYAFACGLVLLMQRRWFVHGAAFTLAALVAGGQWYVWNWLHSGDPFFPLLYGLVPYADPTHWDAAHAADLQAMIRDDERAVPIGLGWLLAYPFVATLAGKPIFESGRTGFGPLVLLALPFALAGLWRFRRRIAGHPLLPVAAIVAIFYAEWFLMGSSQRLRHMLPAYPLVLLAVMVAARKAASARPLAAAIGLTLAVQLGGQAVFAAGHLRYLASDESRDQFYERSVGGYAPIPWINANLGPADRLYMVLRSANYLVDVPIFYAHFVQEAQVDVSPRATDPRRFYAQLRAVGATHLLVAEADGPAVGLMLWKGLRDIGCLDRVRGFRTRFLGSRALGLEGTAGEATVYRLKEPGCSSSPG